MENSKRLSLEDVNQLFTTWRTERNHKGRIPDELWEAAVALSRHYSVHLISKTLRVNHSALRDRITIHTQKENTLTKPSFLELPSPSSSSISECHVEMENRNGERIRMHFTGEIDLDLLALSRDFWTGKP